MSIQNDGHSLRSASAGLASALRWRMAAMLPQGRSRDFWVSNPSASLSRRRSFRSSKTFLGFAGLWDRAFSSQRRASSAFPFLWWAIAR